MRDHSTVVIESMEEQGSNFRIKKIINKIGKSSVSCNKPIPSSARFCSWGAAAPLRARVLRFVADGVIPVAKKGQYVSPEVQKAPFPPTSPLKSKAWQKKPTASAV